MSRRVLLLLALIAALTAAGCGSDDEPEGEKLPRATVSELEQRLEEIERRYSTARDRNLPGACDDIEKDSFPAVDRLLSSLPDDVDPDIRQATGDSFARLRDLTSEGCSDVEPAETETTPPETEIETIPPEPPPPPQTQTTPPETETTSPDPDDQNRNGNGNDNENGNGGTPPGQGGGGLEAPPTGNGD